MGLLPIQTALAKQVLNELDSSLPIRWRSQQYFSQEFTTVHAKLRTVMRYLSHADPLSQGTGEQGNRRAQVGREHWMTSLEQGLDGPVLGSGNPQDGTIESSIPVRIRKNLQGEWTPPLIQHWDTACHQQNGTLSGDVEEQVNRPSP